MTQDHQPSPSETPLALIGTHRLIPLLTIEDASLAVPLARTLVEAGLPVMEVALRTKAATHAMRDILREVPEAILAAGNVMTAFDLALAREMGVHFAISPGHSDALLKAAADNPDLPFVPGIATPAELIRVLSAGFHVVKFFPAMAFGGPEAVRAMMAPFPHARFIPSGGTNEERLDDWLALPNVVAVGGAWLAPPDEIAKKDWAAIGKRARDMLARVKH